MKVEIELPEFEGYEFVGYKVPAYGEHVLKGVLLLPNCGVLEQMLTYRKIKYREPTQADVGKMVEVKVNEGQWKSRKLLCVIDSSSPFIVRFGSDNHYSWRYARIVDDGTARQPREVWLHWNQDVANVVAKKPNFSCDLSETVHFREVME